MKIKLVYLKHVFFMVYKKKKNYDRYIKLLSYLGSLYVGSFCATDMYIRRNIFLILQFLGFKYFKSSRTVVVPLVLVEEIVLLTSVTLVVDRAVDVFIGVTEVTT